MKSNRNWTRFARDYGVQVIILVGIWVGFGLGTPGLRGESGIYSVLLGFSLLGLISLGIATAMLAGELDASIGGLVAVSGAIAVKTASLGLAPAIAIAMGACVLIGIAQGLVIATLRINSLIVTIGSLIVLGGVAFLICGGKPISVSNFSVVSPLLDRWSVFSWDIIAAIVAFVVVLLFLFYSKFGREIYAIGGGRAQALAAGVPLRRPIVIAFAISGACCGLAGAFASLKSASAQPTVDSALLLQAVTAALVGGISLYGGRGTVFNVILGVAILTVLSAGLSGNGAQNYVVQLWTGAVLLAVVFLEYLAELLNLIPKRSSQGAEMESSP